MTARIANALDAQAIHDNERAAAHRPWSLADTQSHLTSSHGITWVVTHDRFVVGHILATSLFDEGEIYSIAVHPAHRRQGFARLLLERLHLDWVTRGVQRGFLEVRDDNKAARGLYEATGWHAFGTRTNYYSDGTDAVLMSWETT